GRVAHRDERPADDRGVRDEGARPLRGKEDRGAHRQEDEEDRQHEPALPGARRPPSPSIALRGEPVPRRGHGYFTVPEYVAICAGATPCSQGRRYSKRSCCWPGLSGASFQISVPPAPTAPPELWVASNVDGPSTRSTASFGST